jgi:hypothetical protein
MAEDAKNNLAPHGDPHREGCCGMRLHFVGLSDSDRARMERGLEAP